MIGKETIELFIIGLTGNFIGTLVGGGGLITLPAMILFGIPVQLGIGTNKFSSGVAALSNVLNLLTEKQIPLKTILGVAALGFFGGITGGLITSNINERVLNILVIVLLLFALIITLKGKPSKDKEKGNPVENPTLLQKILSYFIGLYDGGFGPGSSTLAIMLFMHRGSEYVQAVHLTRTLIFGSNMGALLVYFNTGLFNWHYALPLAAGSIIAAQLGFKILPKVSQRAARFALILITLLLMVQIIFKLLK